MDFAEESIQSQNLLKPKNKLDEKVKKSDEKESKVDEKASKIDESIDESIDEMTEQDKSEEESFVKHAETGKSSDFQDKVDLSSSVSEDHTVPEESAESVDWMLDVQKAPTPR